MYSRGSRFPGAPPDSSFSAISPLSTSSISVLPFGVTRQSATSSLSRTLKLACREAMAAVRSVQLGTAATAPSRRAPSLRYEPLRPDPPGLGREQGHERSHELTYVALAVPRAPRQRAGDGRLKPRIDGRPGSSQGGRFAPQRTFEDCEPRMTLPSR